VNAYATALKFADRQHGVVSRRQLVGSAVPGSTIASQVAAGRLFPVFPGVYAVGRGHVSWNGMWHAGVLASGEGAALAFRTAATAWGFLDYRRSIEMLRTKKSSSFRSRVGIEGDRRRVFTLVRRTKDLPDTDISHFHGIPVTSVARTLSDLAALLGAKPFDRAVLEADRLGLIIDAELAAMVARSRGRTGSRMFRDRVVRRFPDVARTRSVLEAIFFDLISDYGLPAPEVNGEVRGFTVDFVWRSARVIVELDGYEFHRGREAWERDLRRQNELENAGWTVCRFTWAMVNDSPALVAETLNRALARSGAVGRVAR
jgi:hypothetical protein